MKRYALMTVDNPGMFRSQDIVRSGDGKAHWAIPRSSGKVRLYDYRSDSRRGNPFSRPLSLENQERLEAAKDAVYGPWLND